MIYAIDYLPRYRESGHDGHVGLKGYMDYFQDIAAGLYHQFGKGNDKIHEAYGVAWLYTKYRLKLYKKIDFDHSIRIASWISKLDAVRSWQELEITRGEELVCEGRLESCLIDLKSLAIARIPRIELPDGLPEDRMTSVGAFSRRMRMSADAAYRYTHTVRYSDLDNNRHMNNLHYVDMFMNAFDMEFFDRFFISDFEIHYVSQAYFGEELRVFCEQSDGQYRLFALNRDDAIVASCIMEVRPNE